MRLNVLKEFARHGKVEMTLRYTHTAEEELAEFGMSRRADETGECNRSNQTKNQTKVVVSRDLMSSVVRRPDSGTKRRKP